MYMLYRIARLHDRENDVLSKNTFRNSREVKEDEEEKKKKGC